MLRTKMNTLLGRIYTSIGFVKGLTEVEAEGDLGIICDEIEEAVISAFED
jgi:hypothetical protein